MIGRFIKRSSQDSKTRPILPVPGSDPWRGASMLETSLWLAAQDDYKFRVFAGLRAQRFVRDDEGRSRPHPLCDKIKRILRNCDPVKRCFRAFRFGRHDAPVTAFSHGPIRIVSPTLGTPAGERYDAPSNVGARAF